MRRLFWISAACLCLIASPAAAQVDGQAAISGEAGFELAGAPQPLAVSDLRRVAGHLLAEGLTPTERDFLEEIAAGQAFSVRWAEGDSISVQPASEEARALARLVLAPPNMHMLWQQPGEKAAQLIELSRLNTATHERVVLFIANKILEHWDKTGNLGVPELQAGLANQWNYFRDLPDVQARLQGMKLMTQACFQAIERSQPRMGDFICAWTQDQAAQKAMSDGVRSGGN